MEPTSRIRELEGRVAQLTALVKRLGAAQAAQRSAARDHRAGGGTERTAAGPRGRKEHEFHLVEDVRRTVDQVLLAEEDEAIETHVGAVWISRLAAVVLMMALALAARTTFANQEIEEIGKALIGYGIAAFFIGYGLIFERSRDLFAQAILGCGLAVLYFTTYAVFFIEEMQLWNAPFWGIPITLGCLLVLVFMAHVRSSETVAGAGLFLAYYTVYFSCTRLEGLSGPVHAAATCSLLAAVALVYQASHRWLLFSWAVMVATYTVHGYYYLDKPAAIPLDGAAYFWASSALLTAFFLIFAATSIAGRRRRGFYRPMVAPMAALNVVAYYLFMSHAIARYFPGQFWCFQAALALFLFLCAFLSETRGSRSNLLFQTYILGAIAVTSLALYESLPPEYFPIALALECIVLTLFYQRSAVIGFKSIELFLMLATAIAAIGAVGMTGPVQIGVWLAPANRFCAGSVALLFMLNAWLYEKFTRHRTPAARTRSGHWFLADSRLDWTGNSMAMAHAACGALVLMAATILELSEAPELPFILGAEALVVWLFGIILLTPQVCVAAVLLLVAAHVCFHVFLWLPLEGFETQQYYLVYSTGLAVLTFLGGHAWERYLIRFRRPDIDWEHHLIVAVPFLVGTYLLTALLGRELNPLHVAAAQSGLGLGLLFLGGFNRYTGVKTAGVLAMMLAVSSFYTGLNHPDAPLDREPLFLLYFGIFLGACMGAERVFAFLKKHGSATTRIEDVLRTVLVWMAMVLGLLGLYRWSPPENLVFYLLVYAVIALVLGVVFRESRYRWGALLLFGVVTYRAFTQFQDLTPPYQVLVFGVPGVVLIVVSWAYSRRTLRNKKRGQAGPPAPTDG
ncbi:MAG: DUF2339 domain-containing protein [Candidatus Hydrogenedentes bacterium]|nr:DUF2339 domain-containing protein [Candidatus Hydrogenedentota bacterium]